MGRWQFDISLFQQIINIKSLIKRQIIEYKNVLKLSNLKVMLIQVKMLKIIWIYLRGIKNHKDRQTQLGWNCKKFNFVPLGIHHTSIAQMRRRRAS